MYNVVLKSHFKDTEHQIENEQKFGYAKTVINNLTSTKFIK